jgi:hypothetical protein
MLPVERAAHDTGSGGSPASRATAERVRQGKAKVMRAGG